jgi:hypothetical protein
LVPLFDPQAAGKVSDDVQAIATAAGESDFQNASVLIRALAAAESATIGDHSSAPQSSRIREAPAPHHP